MTCQDFFDVHLNNNDKCKLLQKEPSKYTWQLESASKFSPHPVQDEEPLIRQIISPIHLDTDSKTLKPTAFDDVFNKGLSVNRSHLITSEAQVIDAASLKTKVFNITNPEKPQRKLHALTKFVAINIRTLTDYENNFGLGIYDTALERDSSHADICHISVDNKQNQRSIRSKLLDLANQNLTVI
ncbi:MULTISPECIES: hypothetical protein [Methylotenera]|uniref:hypothetical protein n=1 Tax=Methylotenera TaxID=359407 RepID=UPI0003621A6E|nr:MULTISPECIES: hypothetical protein [Methylotenera]